MAKASSTGILWILALGLAAACGGTAPEDVSPPSPPARTSAATGEPTAVPATPSPWPTWTPSPFVKDQENLGVGARGAFCIGDDRSLTQSFTPSEPLLAAVDLGLAQPREPVALPMGVSIRSERPTGPILGTATASMPAEWQRTVRFVFSPEIEVVPGQIYFIEWIEPPGDLVQWSQTEDNYPGGLLAGCGSIEPSIDMVFATYTLHTP